jgi:hypothetical protein
MAVNFRQAAGAAARAAPDKRGVIRLQRWCAKHSCAALMMRRGAGLDTDQARRQLLEEGQYLAALKLAA